MGMLREFKSFALRGNVVDMAVGVVIGGAFGRIVSSLVSDIIMPPLGLITGNKDFSDYAIVLREQTETAEAVTLKIGLFVNSIVDFVIIALVIFLVIRQMNRVLEHFGGQEPPKPATTKSCTYCQTTIPIKATRCPNCTSQLIADGGQPAPAPSA
jgi:large conductance mechanosensitive channel